MVLVISDSHCCMYSGFDYVTSVEEISGEGFFRVCRIGPSTAHGLHNKHQWLLDLLKEKGVTKNDTLVLLFGEIDIRVHIARLHILNNTPISNLIKDTLRNYFMEIDRLVKAGYKNIVVSGTPCSSYKEELRDADLEVDFPRWGSEVDRNKIGIEFNNRMKEECVKRKLRFLDIFPKFINDDLTSKQDLFSDAIHLKSSVTMPLIMEEWDKINPK